MSEAPFGAKAPTEAELVGGRDHADRRSSDEREIGEVGEGRPQRYHLLDAAGPALRQDLCQQPAAAVPDQGNARSVLLLDLCNTVTETGQHSL
jgi:hypothetical protein